MSNTPIKELTQKFHHNQIIDKCKHLFFKRELVNVTSDEICVYAGYSKRTIYVYFKSKEDIYTQVVSGCIDIFSGLLKNQNIVNMSAFLNFVKMFEQEHELEYYYLMGKTFNCSEDRDYFEFGEKFRPFLNMLAEGHNYVFMNNMVPIVAWNMIVYGFNNQLALPLIEKLVLRGLEGCQ